jgi:hypothetical protein
MVFFAMPKPQTILKKGQRFGRLTVVSFHSFVPTKWLCQCDCGRMKIAWTKRLKRGWTTSCGCRLKELRAGAARRIHGEAAIGKVTKEYRAWVQSQKRCYNPKDPRFAHYGGRGITVSQEWRDDYQVFLRDMGRCPVGHSLDRIDNNGPYSRNNCRWGSRIQQANNTRVNRVLTLQGVTHTLAEWSRLTGIKRSTITQRIDYYGWSIEEALSNA